MTNDTGPSSLEQLLNCLLSQDRSRDLLESFIQLCGTLPAILESMQFQTPKPMPPENLHMLLSMIPQLYQLCGLEQLGEAPQLDTLSSASEFVSLQYVNTHYEKVGIICLDEHYRLKSFSFVGEGGLREVSFYPRRLLSEVFKYKAHAFILCHNHPSGWAFFSEDDVNATRDLLKLCGHMKLAMIDHLLIADSTVMSMRSRAYIPETAWTNVGPDTIPLGKWRKHPS